jgi:N utilization substance protein A
MGCVTAKSVLNTPREDIIRRADLEEETVDNVLEVLRAEFEDEEEAPAAEAAADEAPAEQPVQEAPAAEDAPAE